MNLGFTPRNPQETKNPSEKTQLEELKNDPVQLYIPQKLAIRSGKHRFREIAERKDGWSRSKKRQRNIQSKKRRQENTPAQTKKRAEIEKEIIRTEVENTRNPVCRYLMFRGLEYLQKQY